MGLYGFKPQFVAPILVGTKRHTIRRARKYQDVAGTTMYLYRGLRTKSCTIIGTAVCAKVELIYIEPRFLDAPPRCASDVNLIIEGANLSVSEIEALARADGFKDFGEMIAFWNTENELPFHGFIFHWKDFRKGRSR